MKTRHKNLLIYAYFTVLVVAILLPNAYVWPNRDSGVFLYAGQRILGGEIPYRDFWDHKPPGIFYLNALGLVIGGGSPWGVWIVECASLFLATVLSYCILRKVFGTIPAVVGTTSWLGILPVPLDTGNYTEEYALPFQFLIILACLQLLRRQSSRYWAAALGFGIAAFLLLRPNLVGMAIAAAIVLTLRMGNWKALLSSGSVALAVVGTILLIVSLFFMRHNAFTEFFDAVIQYNFAYVQAGAFSFRDSLFIAWEVFTVNGLLYIVLPTCIAGGIYIAVKKRALERSQFNVVLLGFVTLPIEAALSAVSGRGYLHYYIAWLPSLAIFIALFAYFLVMVCGGNILQRDFRSRVTRVILGALLFCLLLPIGFHIYTRVEIGDAWGDVGQRSIEYIKQETSPDDSVLMWGAEAGVNFASGRRAPSRFAYQYPLFNGAEDIEEFVSDVQRNAPVLIFDAVSTVNTQYINAPSIASLISQSSADTNSELRKWSSFATYLAENYEAVDVLGEAPIQWVIYRKIDQFRVEER